MPRNFYFGKEADIVAGSANFNSLIGTGFASYGLTSSQSTAFGVVNTALQSAYPIAIEPSTRTAVTIRAKNLAIRNMRANAITLAKIITATTTVTDGMLVGLGLLPRSTRAPIPVTPTPPVLEPGVVSGRMVNIRIHAQGSERRGKPSGAASCNIYSYVGATPPADSRDYHFEGATTRSATQIVFPDSVAGGATVWLSACWVSARGQIGLACTPIAVALQGGGTLPVAA